MMCACKQEYILCRLLLSLKPLSCMAENVFFTVQVYLYSKQETRNAIPFSPLLNFLQNQKYN